MLAQDGKLATRVGAIVLLLISAAIVFFVFVSGRLELGERTRLHVLFKHTGELREGAPVIVAGRAVGRVEAIALAPRALARPGADGNEDGVDVTLVFHTSAAREIARGGDVFVSSRGSFLSARHLEIGPSPTPEGPSLAADTRPLRGIDPPTMDRVMGRTWDNLMIAKRFADEVGPEFRTLRDRMRELAATLESVAPSGLLGAVSLRVELDGLFAEVDKFRAALGGDRGVAQLGAMVGHARITIAQARRVLDLLDAKATALASSIDALRARLGERGPAAVKAVETAIEKLRVAIDKIDPLLAKVEDLNQRFARGEGTIGKLARDPEFPEDAKALGKMLKRQPWLLFMRPKDN